MVSLVGSGCCQPMSATGVFRIRQVLKCSDITFPVMSRSHACAATPACRLNPPSFATWAYRSSSSTPGKVCSVPTVGAIGEHLAPLLWPHGDPLTDRATNELLHGVFVHAFQLQVAVFFNLLQYALTFKKLGYAVTDGVDK